MKGGAKMCQNINNLYFKFAIATLIATVIGIIAGIVWPAFFTNFPTLLLIEIITAALTIIIIAVFLLTRVARNNQNYSYLKYFIRFLLFGAFGSFIITTIAFSTTLTANLVSSIIFGIAIAFFVLLILGIILILEYLLRTANFTRE